MPAMPLFYTEVRVNDRAFSDTVGSEFAGREEARLAAIATLPTLARDVLPTGKQSHLTVLIRDENSRLVYTGVLSFYGRWVEGV